MTKLYQFPSGKISYLSQSTSPAGSVETAPLSLSGAAYTGVSNQLANTSFLQMSNLTLLNFSDMFNLILLVYLGLGIGIGVLGSSISMRKYLEV